MDSTLPCLPKTRFDLVRHRRCNNFCTTPIELVIEVIVYEFYTALKDQKNCRQQAPTHNASDVTAYGVVMLYSILQKDQICIGYWIYEEMLKCIGIRKQ
ncbi:hypothetical protein J1N35_001633, partial [Gossypium stocksii]